LLTLNFLKKIGKPILGIGLLMLVIWQLDVSEIWGLLNRLEWVWFAVGFVSLTFANFVSAYRWALIAKELGISVRLVDAIKFYAQGVLANTVLPGGIVGGDVWRTLSLVNQGAEKSNAALSVFLDRLSGVWVLGVCSLAALIFLLAVGKMPIGPSRLELLFYCATVFGLALFPFFLFLISKVMARVFSRTFIISMIVQCFALIAFWACFRSVGQAVPVVSFVAVCAGIFIAAVIPAAVGGFGARELGAVVLMGPLGIAPEVSFIASVLYGMMATLQGLLSGYWWVRSGYNS
jgi:uncharacterized membrane protein YbhN (UPF0104 family)